MYDVIILGAGAAGLMCAIEAGKRGRKVLVLEKSNKPGKKILMSGGGRCNFTNYGVSPERYLSHNPHFCKSALKRYTQWDFIQLVEQYKIPYHEKTLGQLFCDRKASDILNMLLAECEKVHVTLQLNAAASEVIQLDNGKYQIKVSGEKLQCDSLVVASGGLSIPTLGGSGFGYEIAKQFGLKVYPTRAGLVPLTWQPDQKSWFEALSGVAVDAEVFTESMQFKEAMLFTHRGISGPAVLQISSYWQPGEAVTLKLLPELDLYETLVDLKHNKDKRIVINILQDYYPKKLIQIFLERYAPQQTKQSLQDLSHDTIRYIAHVFQAWRPELNGTEGYRTAEVTLGGVDTDQLSSKTMMANDNPGLFFIGEVVDVTGWLGGYNFQWAWSSAVAAGKVV